MVFQSEHSNYRTLLIPKSVPFSSKMCSMSRPNYPNSDPGDADNSVWEEKSPQRRRSFIKAETTGGPFDLVSEHSFERLRDLIDAFWLLEISAWIISAAAISVTIIALFHYDGEPIPHWPYGLTMNTTISIFSIIVKACVLVPIAASISQLKCLWIQKERPLQDIQTFDEASRGPWGSFGLLCRTKGL